MNLRAESQGRTKLKDPKGKETDGKEEAPGLGNLEEGYGLSRVLTEAGRGNTRQLGEV